MKLIVTFAAISSCILILLTDIQAQLSTELNEAYYRNSHREADQFFKKWEKMSKPAKMSEINDTLRIACDLFEDYILMLEQKKNNSSAQISSHSQKKYILVIPKVNIYMKDTVFYPQEVIDELKRKYENRIMLTADNSSNPITQPLRYAAHFGYDTYGYVNAELVDSVSEFRPHVNMKNKKVLYLTPEYLRALNLFLGADGNSLARGNFKQTLRESDIKKRLEFINRYLAIGQGRIIDFYLSPYPSPYAITFESDFRHARIDYILGEQIGFAIFRRADSEWIYLFSSITGSL